MAKPDFMAVRSSVQWFYQAKMYLANTARRNRDEVDVVPGLTAALQRSVVHAQVPVLPSLQFSSCDVWPQPLERVLPS